MKKIVVIGPESTGKSSLCEQLARHFQTVWVPEYARKWLLENGKNYDYADLLTIARGQIGGEDLVAASAASAVFIDTDMFVMKIWCEFVFGKCHEWILNQIASRRYDLYLLCNTDLPWIKDELREYPDLETREKLFHMYKDCMVNQQTHWLIISGDYHQRIETAVQAVEAFWPPVVDPQ